jgi:hypothetical protein
MVNKYLSLTSFADVRDLVGSEADITKKFTAMQGFDRVNQIVSAFRACWCKPVQVPPALPAHSGGGGSSGDASTIVTKEERQGLTQQLFRAMKSANGLSDLEYRGTEHDKSMWRIAANVEAEATKRATSKDDYLERLSKYITSLKQRAAQKQAGDKKTIVIRIKNMETETTTFYKIKMTTKLEKVFRAFSVRVGINCASLHFALDAANSTPIADGDTAATLGLMEQSIIYAWDDTARAATVIIPVSDNDNGSAVGAATIVITVKTATKTVGKYRVKLTTKMQNVFRMVRSSAMYAPSSASLYFTLDEAQRTAQPAQNTDYIRQLFSLVRSQVTADVYQKITVYVKKVKESTLANTDKRKKIMAGLIE